MSTTTRNRRASAGDATKRYPTIFQLGELVAVHDLYMDTYTSGRVERIERADRFLVAGRWYDAAGIPCASGDRRAFRLHGLTSGMASLCVRGDALAAIRGVAWEQLDTPTLQRVADALGDTRRHEP